MSEAQLAAAQSAIESGDNKKAISILEPLCESGSIEAMTLLGTLYQTSAESTHEGERAVTLLSLAADLGSGLAAHNLSTAFVTGLPGVPANLEASRKYLHLAKSLGVELLPKRFYE